MTDLTDLLSRRGFIRSLAGVGIGMSTLAVFATTVQADGGGDDQADSGGDDSGGDGSGGDGSGGDDSGGDGSGGDDEGGGDNSGPGGGGDTAGGDNGGQGSGGDGDGDDSSGPGGGDDGASPRTNDGERVRNVTVRYSDGWIELILDGQYKLIDNLNRQVILRRATIEDFNRMVALGS